MRTRLAALLTGALVLLGLSVPVGAAASLSVIWPAVTSFNPDLDPYTFTIEDDGGGTLFADWRGDRVEIPHSGQVTMTFPTDGDGQILLLRCGGDGACSQITDSPPLHVLSKLEIRAASTVTYASPYVPTKTSAHVKMPSGTPFDFDWEIRETADTEDPDNEVLASGTAQAIQKSQYPWTDTNALSFHYQAPPGLVQGQTYTLLVDAAGHSDVYGDLSGSYTQSISYDALASVSIEATQQLFYPERDNYLDRVVVSVVSSGTEDVAVSVRDQAGKVLRPRLPREASRVGNYSWDGRLADGSVVAEGVYTVRVVGTDWAGNYAKDEIEVTVSRKRLRMLTFERTFSAKDALIDRSVGSCSRLASPSSHGGKGSLGYYSQTTCRDAAKSSVETEFGIYVPQALEGKYGDLTVSFVGGAAKRAKKAYLVMYRYDSVLKKYVARYQHTAAWGQHALRHPWSGEKSVVGQKGPKPTIYWWAGLTEGARYDIQSFTVSLQYQALA